MFFPCSLSLFPNWLSLTLQTTPVPNAQTVVHCDQTDRTQENICAAKHYISPISNTICFANKFKLYKFLVTSVFLHGCEAWILLANCKKIIQAFETNYMPEEISRRLLLGAQTDDWMQSKINFKGAHRNLLRQLSRDGIGRVTRHDSLSKSNLWGGRGWGVGGTLEVGSCRGRQKTTTTQNNAGWTTSKSGHPCL